MGSGGVGASRDGERLKKSMTRSLSAGLASTGLASSGLLPGGLFEGFVEPAAAALGVPVRRGPRWYPAVLVAESSSTRAMASSSERSPPVDILSSQRLPRQTLGKRLPRAIVNLLARFWRRFRELRHGPGQQIVKISHDERPFSGRMTTSPYPRRNIRLGIARGAWIRLARPAPAI